MPLATYTILVLALMSKEFFLAGLQKYRKAVLVMYFIGYVLHTTATRQQYE